jgi:excinuclease ABC subunit C
LKESGEGLDPEEGKFSRLPDVLFIDGGKGQVSSAEKAMAKLGLGVSIPVCGMVKDDRHRTRGLIYNNQEILPNVRSEGFKLITRIQDETHRFAVEYHRKLREQAMLHSVLDDIPGIGPARRKALLRFFGSVDGIEDADVETLMKAEKMNAAAAKKVYEFFHREGGL